VAGIASDTQLWALQQRMHISEETGSCQTIELLQQPLWCEHQARSLWPGFVCQAQLLNTVQKIFTEDAVLISAA
jgi:hypothetical protein